MKYIVSKHLYKDIKNMDKHAVENLYDVLCQIENANSLVDIRMLKKWKVIQTYIE